ncbi:MAG TPA: hypothetical protein ENO11_02805 [Desulfobacteraceae bacterium]|nr:hypothetical protein [Desulfobacteraceae bacterium]
MSFAEAPQGVAEKKSALQIADFRQHPRSTLEGHKHRLPEGSNGTGVRSGVAKTTRRGSFFGQAKNEQYYQILAGSVKPFRIPSPKVVVFITNKKREISTLDF